MNLAATASTSTYILRSIAREHALPLRAHTRRVIHSKLPVTPTSSYLARQRTFTSSSRRQNAPSTSSSTLDAAPKSASLSSPARPFTFHVGLSFIAKPVQEDDGPPPNVIPFPDDHPVIGFRNRMLAWPKEVPIDSAGHDFFFVQEMRNKSGLAVGIADGVGGWGDILDPSQFSQGLMYYASEVAAQNWPGEPESDPLSEEAVYVPGDQLSPIDCMEQAFRRVAKDKAVQGGASTACVMTFDAAKGRMQAANIGDSGFYVIRGAKILHAQNPQQHYFNCPKQLSKFPPGFDTSRAIQDLPRDADTYSLGLQHGDIIVAYTDGLSDNVYRQETLHYVMSSMRRPPVLSTNLPRTTETPNNSSMPEDQIKAQFLADFLVIHARRCMFDFGRVSPFEEEWAKSQRSKRVYRGGKIDE
ncbi:hypothetical protein DL93DRAFT_2049703 [Clavulina sp. PMI_390]|nr:hypothetical protein DL93DRAFT_2049703 [Clavulina sp. PMI_390]